jgi:hypothetical protein
VFPNTSLDMASGTGVCGGSTGVGVGGGSSTHTAGQRSHEGATQASKKVLCELVLQIQNLRTKSKSDTVIT